MICYTTICLLSNATVKFPNNSSFEKLYLQSLESLDSLEDNIMQWMTTKDLT